MDVIPSLDAAAVTVVAGGASLSWESSRPIPTQSCGARLPRVRSEWLSIGTHRRPGAFHKTVTQRDGVLVECGGWSLTSALVGVEHTGTIIFSSGLGVLLKGSSRVGVPSGRRSGNRAGIQKVSRSGGEMVVMEGDVVEYPLTAGDGSRGRDEGGGRRGVGVIVDLSEDSDTRVCHIEPLCQENPGSKEWISDEFQPEITVPVGQVRILQAWYSQRMVPDRISNPHGEHAEDLWIIE